MKPLSKVWAYWLLATQGVNALAAGLMALNAIPDSVPGAAAWKAHALMIHATVAAVVGALQAFAKALPDADGDGTPDLFDDTPNGPQG